MIPFSYSFFLHYSLVPFQPQVCHGTEKGFEAKEKGSVTEKGIEAKEKGRVTEKGIEAKEERFQSTEVCSLQTCQAQYFQQQSQGESTTLVC